jgi:hypothetical protein
LLHKGKSSAIIFHGKADQIILDWSVEPLIAKMKEVGNNCTLVRHEGKRHGFFNYRTGKGEAFASTMRATEKFLRKLGCLV